MVITSYLHPLEQKGHVPGLDAVFIEILLNKSFPKFVFNKDLSFNADHELMFVCFNPRFTQPLQSSGVTVKSVVLSYTPKVASLGVLQTKMHCKYI